MKANKTLTPYGLQLYLYLAGNSDDYQFALSPEAAEQAVDIKRTSFYKYLSLLEEKGYLVWRSGNFYDFYTSPRPENERTHPDKHDEFINFEKLPQPPHELDVIATQIINLQDEPPKSLCKPNCSRSSIEIDNTDLEDHCIDKKIDNAGKPRTPAAAAVPAASATIVEKVITIPIPRNEALNIAPKPIPFAFLDEEKAEKQEQFIF